MSSENVMRQTFMTQHDITVTVTIILKQHPKQQPLPPFSLIHYFGKQNTCGNFSKFLSVLRVIDRSDRNHSHWCDLQTFFTSC